MPSPTGDTAEADEVSIPECALKVAADRRIQVFRDELGNPCISFPDDTTEPAWPLYDQRVYAWFAEEIHRIAPAVFAKDRDILPALRILEGRAWKLPPRPPSANPTWRFLEGDAVSVAMIAYANQKGGFQGRTRTLFDELGKYEIQTRLERARLASKFPANTQALSRQLQWKRRNQALAYVGLDVSIEHKEDGSHCWLQLRRTLFVRETDSICVSGSGPVRSNNEDKALVANLLGVADATDATPQEAFLTNESAAGVLSLIRSMREVSDHARM